MDNLKNELVNSILNDSPVGILTLEPDPENGFNALFSNRAASIILDKTNIVAGRQYSNSLVTNIDFTNEINEKLIAAFNGGSSVNIEINGAFGAKEARVRPGVSVSPENGSLII
jgi:hypothetical protein